MLVRHVLLVLILHGVCLLVCLCVFMGACMAWLLSVSLPLCCFSRTWTWHGFVILWSVLSYFASFVILCQFYILPVVCCQFCHIFRVLFCFACCRILPVLIYFASFVICCQFSHMLPVLSYVASIGICCQFCHMLPVLFYVASVIICCQFCHTSQLFAASPRKLNLFDRPPTRSGSGNTTTETATEPPPPAKPGTTCHGQSTVFLTLSV